MSPPPPVPHHDPAAHRFTDGEASLAYARPAPGLLDIRGVHVPPDRRGGGVAARLTHAAFDYAAAHNLRVRPTCPYVAGAFLKRNPARQAQLEDAAP